jgi:hypothetical protein
MVSPLYQAYFVAPQCSDHRFLLLPLRTTLERRVCVRPKKEKPDTSKEESQERETPVSKREPLS